ncbi:MAG: tRNA 4-thiouridine(8) synthase ThiI [Candidatus Omnitrophica bacterium]|nr:tRNA 4-thiouridine(8) synthase ThiI [Candidatus Omnitrophota bacterium]MBU4473349.1 tRNA 4-thiouridine(8) synthase ThiI [Candidatus Omnitrophota bacterium]MCG2707017.1 tRNA 4-thiouridine(8) synthase ThiI [Candidatus Omnitrophota bacterium]
MWDLFYLIGKTDTQMKAIALISGGLDSAVATRLIKEQGVELIGLNTVSPFCLCNRRSRKGCLYGSGEVTKKLGLKLISINVTEEFLEIVKKPRHGYGSNMNPCIDCRILLFKKAKEAMQKEGASFIVTGEVLGQRPMSQKLNTMRLIEREAGLEGLVLRPLSAKILSPTIPEEQGWISRDKLLAISGRGRREQMNLACELGINDYPCPSGGCLLTDPEFSKRLRDLMKYGKLNLDGIKLLKVGRHFRLDEDAKLIIGRNEKENERLFNLAQENDYLFMPKEIAGPTTLGRGDFSDELIRLSCSITCRYSDLNGNLSTDIAYRRIPEKEDRILKVSPIQENQLIGMRI